MPTAVHDTEPYPRRTLRAAPAAAVLAAASWCAAAPAAAASLPAADTGHLLVSMWTADEVAVFDTDGTPVERFSAEGLDGPRGLAFHPRTGELWVAGELSDALHVFDAERRLVRTVEHPELDGPVGITFVERRAAGDGVEIYVSNSDANEVLVLDEGGEPVRRFTAPALVDPGCSAVMPDGTLFVANRLGGSAGTRGAVSRFSEDETFAFDFTTAGLVSTMAVARDPNDAASAADDTLWVTSGAGELGIHEFDTGGNLLRTVRPSDIPGGASIVPQGIAFDDRGHFFVVSWSDEVFEFDGEGSFVSRFPTGAGTARSTAFEPCDDGCPTAADAADAGTSVDGNEADGDTGSGGGGGSSTGALLLTLLAGLVVRRRTGRRPSLRRATP